MQRYNMFNQIHKALRAMLYETSMQLQHAAFENTEDAQDAIESLQLVLKVFHSHASHEDEFVNPVMRRHAPSLADEFESEHERDELLSVNLHNLVDAYRLAADAQARLSVGYAITMAFNDFIAFNLYHMNKEEEKINELLWKHYSDEALKDITHTIIAHIPPEEQKVETKWMMRGLNNAEIGRWLCAVKNNAPDVVFRSLFTTAEEELPAGRWNDIKDALMEGAMMA